MSTTHVRESPDLKARTALKPRRTKHDHHKIYPFPQKSNLIITPSPTSHLPSYLTASWTACIHPANLEPDLPTQWAQPCRWGISFRITIIPSLSAIDLCPTLAQLATNPANRDALIPTLIASLIAAMYSSISWCQRSTYQGNELYVSRKTAARSKRSNKEPCHICQIDHGPSKCLRRSGAFCKE